MSRGELRSTLKAGASADELARWRQENGIPSEPKGYKVNMPQGRAQPKEDDAFLQSFLKTAHASNYTQAQVDAAIAGFYSEVDRQEQALDEKGKEAIQKADERLRDEWKGEYTLNKNLAEAFLARAPAGFKDLFMEGYLANHMPMRSSVELWRWLAQSEREINPTATVLPGQTTGLDQTIDGEMKEWKRKMAAPKGSPEWKEYWEGGGEARYRKLLEAKSGLKKKAGATA
jgi:hypothetical protein